MDTQRRRTTRRFSAPRRRATWLAGLAACVLAAPAAGAPTRTVGRAVTAQADAPGTREVSAHLSLTVADVAAASARLRELVRAHGGELDSESESSRYAVTVRLSAGRVRDFLSAARGLGRPTSQELTATDARLAAAQLTAQRARAEASLRRREAALERGESGVFESVESLRAQLDGLDQELLAQQDRVARATCGVTLSPEAPPVEEPTYGGEVLFSPGVRASYLLDAGGGGSASLLGVGLAVLPARWLSFEAELFRDVRALGAREGLDAVLVTAGVDVSSDLLGRGHRRFFNPHLGLRLGVAASFGRVDLALGVTAGVELVRLRLLVVDVQLRALAFLGNRAGAHLGLQPGVTVAFAW